MRIGILSPKFPQILPGTFEYSLNSFIGDELDLSVFDRSYCNDDGGRAAYDPAMLLKIVLLAHSRGVTSSRKIEQLCRENVLFMDQRDQRAKGHRQQAAFAI